MCLVPALNTTGRPDGSFVSLFRLGKRIVQIDLNAQFLRLLGQLREQIAIRQLRHIRSWLLGTDIEHLAQFFVRLELAVKPGD